jgi:hypothetical protein
MQYAQFEEALAQMFSIREANLGAFRARLRHLRKLGIPNIPRRGSGNTLAYRREDLFSTYIALALQALGSSPTVAALIARLTARHLQRLRSWEEELFLIVTNVPDPTPKNIGDTIMPPPGAQSISWIDNPFGGSTIACVVSGAAEAGRFVTSAKAVASSVINLSENFKALPKQR